MAVSEEMYDAPFEIIAFGGNAHSVAAMAVEAAREGDFEQAEAYIAEAKESLAQAHEVQTRLLTQEARGDEIIATLIMAHAQDHLTMGALALENAQEFVRLYRLLAEKA